MPVLFERLESRALLATHGLTATYFNNPDFSGSTVERTDRNVSFDFGDHARPAPGIHGNTYSVRWDGLIQPRFSETHTFSVHNNDGVRLWVNGQLLIDNWKEAPRATHSGSIALLAKHYYDLRLEWFDGDRAAAIKLSWSSPSTPSEVIPSTRLFAYDSRFAAIGDFGRTSDYARGTARTVLSWAPDFIVTVGDNNYPDGSASSIDANIGQFYHSFISPYHGNYGRGAATNRFWPALGNHDWDTSGARPYLDYFTLPGNERYYDVVIGPLHFFFIDSDGHEPDGTSPDSVQGQWLKAHMEASTSTYNLVLFHHAPYSSGHHANIKGMRWPFKEWGADAVLAGHDHDYERLVEGGLTYIVDGAGAGPRSIGSPIAGSRVRYNGDSGGMLVQANDIAMTFQFENRKGVVIDTWTIRPS